MVNFMWKWIGCKSSLFPVRSFGVMIKLCFVPELCLQQAQPHTPTCANGAAGGFESEIFHSKGVIGSCVENILYGGKSGRRENEYSVLMRLKRREIKDNRFQLRELKSLVQVQRKQTWIWTQLLAHIHPSDKTVCPSAPVSVLHGWLTFNIKQRAISRCLSTSWLIF